MYERGHGVAPDPERAIYWYVQAAARGEAGAAVQARAIRQRLDAI
jgi:TPR repeat protein